MNITRDGQLDVSDGRFLHESYAEGFPRLAAGDVLLNNTNSRELVGKTTRIDADHEWAFSNHMTVLRFPRVVSHQFMAYQLHFLWMSDAFKPILKQYVNQASISIRALRGLYVVLPPTQEQDKIAWKVDSLLRHIRNAAGLLGSSRVSAGQYMRAVLKAATTGEVLPADGEEGHDPKRTRTRRLTSKQDDSPDTIHQSAKRSCPSAFASLPRVKRGWSLIRVDEAGETLVGMQRHPERHTGANLLPYLRVANVLDNKIDFGDLKHMNFEPRERTRYQLRSGDVLLNEGQSPTLVGRPAMYRGELDTVCFQNTLIRFRAYKRVDAEFALIVFRHYFYAGHFSDIARWSTNIAHLGLRRFSGLPFPLPPIEEQRQICAVVKKRLEGVAFQEEVISKLSERLESLRFAILRRALSGELVAHEQSVGDVDRWVAELRAAVAQRKARDRLTNAQRRRDAPRRGHKRKEARDLSLVEILESAGGSLPTRELFDRSEYDENSIDEFYSMLAQSVREGRIREGRRTLEESTESFDPQSVVELVK